MALTKSDKLLISFKLYLHDNVEHQKTIIQKIDNHLNGTDKISDGDVESSVRELCKKTGVSFTKVINHAKEGFNDP